MKRNLLVSLLMGFALAGHAETENLRQITYDEAIHIALGESYTVKYYKEDMDATRYSYLYTKAQFKPLLNFDFFTPSWTESLTEISQADGLPVSLPLLSDSCFLSAVAKTGALHTAAELHHSGIHMAEIHMVGQKLFRRHCRLIDLRHHLLQFFRSHVFSAGICQKFMRAAGKYIAVRSDLPHEILHAFRSGHDPGTQFLPAVRNHIHPGIRNARFSG